MGDVFLNYYLRELLMLLFEWKDFNSFLSLLHELIVPTTAFIDS